MSLSLCTRDQMQARQRTWARQTNNDKVPRGPASHGHERLTAVLVSLEHVDVPSLLAPLVPDAFLLVAPEHAKVDLGPDIRPRARLDPLDGGQVVELERSVEIDPLDFDVFLCRALVRVRLDHGTVGSVGFACQWQCRNPKRLRRDVDGSTTRDGRSDCLKWRRRRRGRQRHDSRIVRELRRPSTV